MLVKVRLAIHLFMESQITLSGSDDKPILPELELPPRFKVAPVVSRLRIELKRPVLKACAAPATEAQAYNPSSKAETSNVVVHDVKEAEHGAPGAAVSESLDVIPDASAAAGTSPAVPAQAAEVLEPLVSQVKAEDSGAFEGSASMVESVAVAHPAVLKDEGEGKQPVIEEREGGILPKMSEPPSHKEAEGVAVESEVSKGKKRKKRARLMTSDGGMDTMGNKSRKGDRYCYLCGSPDHIARDCVKCVGPYPPHPGPYGAVGPLPPVGMPPYGPDMYWHGPPMPHPGRPYPMNYGEGMFGPGPGMMPLDRPMVPNGPYCMPPYMPRVYHGGPRHEGFQGTGGPGLMHPMERPLTREEFIELQERERVRRLMQDRQERNWSPVRLRHRAASKHVETGDLDGNVAQYADRRVIARDVQPKQTGGYANDSDGDERWKGRKSSKQEEEDSMERVATGGQPLHSSSDDEGTSHGDDQQLQQSPTEKRQQRRARAGSVEGKKEGKRRRMEDLVVDKASSDFDDDGDDKHDDEDEKHAAEAARPVRHQHSVRHHGRERLKEAEAASKHNKRVHSKHGDDESRLDDATGDGDEQASKHRGRRMASGSGSRRDEEYATDLGKRRAVRNVHNSGRRHVSEELESEEEGGRGGSRKHRSHSKSKVVVEAHEHDEYVSGEDERRRRKKHKKHGGSSSEHRRLVEFIGGGGETSGKHRRHHHKSSRGESLDHIYQHQTVESSPSPAKHVRWELETRGRDRKSGEVDPSRHRHRNGRSRHS